ncbi:MAG: YqaE/Pmp3 family membrane protein [Deltaproteobacteria bacterium]|nr:YqaE/Pmp3 family membrane protein [Deltaproteobacteria bacterium]
MFLTVGLGMYFWINILLTILCVVPGMIHALWIIVNRRNSREYWLLCFCERFEFGLARLFSRSYLSSTAE